MHPIRVLVKSPEENLDGRAEFWCGGELMGVTMIRDGELQLRVDSRADGGPWLIDTSSLACGLAEATRLLAAYLRPSDVRDRLGNQAR